MSAVFLFSVLVVASPPTTAHAATKTAAVHGLCIYEKGGARYKDMMKIFEVHYRYQGSGSNLKVQPYWFGVYDVKASGNRQVFNDLTFTQRGKTSSTATTRNLFSKSYVTADAASFQTSSAVNAKWSLKKTTTFKVSVTDRRAGSPRAHVCNAAIGMSVRPLPSSTPDDRALTGETHTEAVGCASSSSVPKLVRIFYSYGKKTVNGTKMMYMQPYAVYVYDTDTDQTQKVAYAQLIQKNKSTRVWELSKGVGPSEAPELIFGGARSTRKYTTNISVTLWTRGDGDDYASKNAKHYQKLCTANFAMKNH